MSYANDMSGPYQEIGEVCCHVDYFLLCPHPLHSSALFPKIRCKLIYSLEELLREAQAQVIAFTLEHVHDLW